MEVGGERKKAYGVSLVCIPVEGSSKARSRDYHVRSLNQMERRNAGSIPWLMTNRTATEKVANACSRSQNYIERSLKAFKQVKCAINKWIDMYSTLGCYKI
jgi:hypothetical protein